MSNLKIVDCETWEPLHALKVGDTLTFNLGEFRWRKVIVEAIVSDNDNTESIQFRDLGGSEIHA